MSYYNISSVGSVHCVLTHPFLTKMFKTSKKVFYIRNGFSIVEYVSITLYALKENDWIVI